VLPFSAGSEVGFSATVGDVNNDGIDDLLVGAPAGSSFRSSSTVDGAMSGVDHQTGLVLVYLGAPLSLRLEPDPAAFSSGAVPPGGATFSVQVLYTALDGSEHQERLEYDASAGESVADVLNGLLAEFARLGDTTGHRIAGAAADSTGTALVIEHNSGFRPSVLPSENARIEPTSVLQFDRVLAPNDFVEIPALGGLLLRDSSAGQVRGSHRDSRFGHAIAVGDFNHDGCADVAVGAPYDFRWTYDSSWGWPVSSGPRVGQVYVYQSPTDGCSSFAPTPPVLWTADVAGAKTGRALAAGNVLGVPEDAQDLIIGSPALGAEDHVTGPGAVHIIESQIDVAGTAGSQSVPPTVRTATDVVTPADSPFRSCGESPDEKFGHALAVGGDQTGDTLMIGSPGSDFACGASDRGTAFAYRQYAIQEEFLHSSRSGKTGDAFGSSILYIPLGSRVARYATTRDRGSAGWLVASANGWGGTSPSRPTSGSEDGGFAVAIREFPSGWAVQEVISQEIWYER